MDSELIRVGTRGSLLAKTQTMWVLQKLQEQHPHLQFELVTIRTSGDVRTHDIPARFAGKGFFTKEIEDALLARTVDLAVHSLKDLPAEWPQDLMLGAIPAREDPRDALVGCAPEDLARDPELYRLGTSSLRRKAQLRRSFPGCQVVDLRGNLDTRLQKTRDGVVDGAVLAAAGLRRLQRDGEIRGFFPPDTMLPAPGQGALALEIRDDHSHLLELLAAVDCASSRRCVTAERTFMHALGGGCQLPVAALATVDGEMMRLRGRVLSLDGVECFEGNVEGTVHQAEEAGTRLAANLQEQGAGEIIRDIERQLSEGPLQ